MSCFIGDKVYPVSIAQERKLVDREILSLALPAAGAGLTALLHTWIDTFWIGQMPDGAIGVASIGVSFFTVWIYGSLGSLLIAGLTGVVGRYVGAGRGASASYSASQGLRGAFWLAVICAASGYFLAPLLLSLSGAEGPVFEKGVAYVRIYWGGGFPIMVGYAATGIFRGYGDTKTPFLLGLVGLGLNVVLDPLFIFGLGPVPAMGVGGAALATVICLGASTGLMLVVLLRRHLVVSKRPPDEDLQLNESTQLSKPGILGLDPAMQWRLARIGQPVAMAGIFFSLVYLVITGFINDRGGPNAVASLSIGHRVEGFAWVIYTAYSAAASSLVARYMGEGKTDVAERMAWRAVLQCACLSAIWGGVLFLFGEEIASVFLAEGAKDSLAVTGGAALYFRITSWSLIFQSCDLVLGGAFSGAGLTLSPMILSASITATRIPLVAWIASAEGSGVGGVWWVIASTAAAKGVLLIFWFRRGSWKGQSI